MIDKFDLSSSSGRAQDKEECSDIDGNLLGVHPAGFQYGNCGRSEGQGKGRMEKVWNIY